MISINKIQISFWDFLASCEKSLQLLLLSTIATATAIWSTMGLTLSHLQYWFPSVATESFECSSVFEILKSTNVTLTTTLLIIFNIFSSLDLFENSNIRLNAVIVIEDCRKLMEKQWGFSVQCHWWVADNGDVRWVFYKCRGNMGEFRESGNLLVCLPAQTPSKWPWQHQCAIKFTRRDPRAMQTSKILNYVNEGGNLVPRPDGNINFYICDFFL